MSNKASSNLHELIRSLSSVEKRYFKLFSERHSTKSKKNYLKLFDKIDSQEVYDEDEILKAFKNDAFVKHLSIAKNRLYHQVLKSLDAFYAQDSAEAEIGRYIHYGEILFQKTLYQQCERILNTAKKMALKYEKWGALLQIIRRQKRLAEIRHYEKGKKSEIEQLRKLEAEVLHKLETESRLWYEKSQIFYNLFTKGQVRDKKLARKMLPAVNELVELSKNSQGSFESTYLNYHTQSAYYFSTGDYPNSYKSLKANAEHMESNLDIIRDEPSLYISVLTNLIYVCAKLNYFDEMHAYLDKTRNLPKPLSKRVNEDLELRIFINSNSLELAICSIKGDLVRGIPLVSETIKDLERWKPKLSDVRLASFYQYFSTLYFIAGQFKDALKWNNELLNSIAIDKTEDQYCFSQIFHLLIHFELGNTDIIPHSLKSLSRYLETRKRHFRFETHFLEFMKQVSREGQRDHSDSLNQFYGEIKSLETDQYEKAVFDYFDFIAWCEAKLSRKPLSDVLATKVSLKDVL